MLAEDGPTATGPEIADPGRSRGVEVLLDTEALDDAPAALLEAAVLRVLADAGVNEAEISVTLLDDDGIRALNLEWLGHDRPTDVIAFALDDEGVLGDVYLGVEQARRQAADLGVPFAEELVRLAVHGTLHVLGHEHPEGPERAASPMFELQERLVRDVFAAPEAHP